MPFSVDQQTREVSECVSVRLRIAYSYQRLLPLFSHLPLAYYLIKNFFLFQSLGILGSIPAAWLILTLFLLLVYLMTRCCDRKPRPKHSIIVLKWTLGIFAVLCW